ncbi:hypothetical protein VPH35_054373 [Triticum aestivum]
MFRRTSSCPHFTSPPPTPPPPSSGSGEGDKEPTRRPLPRCRLQLPPPTCPPARHAAARRPPDSPPPSLPFRGWIQPGVGGCSWRRRPAARSSPEGNAAFFAGFDPGNSLPFESPSTGLD